MPCPTFTLASVYPVSHKCQLTSKVTCILTFLLVSSSMEYVQRCSRGWGFSFSSLSLSSPLFLGRLKLHGQNEWKCPLLQLLWKTVFLANEFRGLSQIGKRSINWAILVCFW